MGYLYQHISLVSLLVKCILLAFISQFNGIVSCDPVQRYCELSIPVPFPFFLLFVIFKASVLAVIKRKCIKIDLFCVGNGKETSKRAYWTKLQRAFFVELLVWFDRPSAHRQNGWSSVA